MAVLSVFTRGVAAIVIVTLVVGCGGSEEAPTLSAAEGPPLSIEPWAPLPDPEPFEPCEDLACCEGRLGPVASDCLELVLIVGHCLLSAAEDGSACAPPPGGGCGATASCVAGQCVVGETTTECSHDGLDACELSVCDEDAGLCVVQARPDGEDCSDDDVCDGDETCLSGECAAGEPLECEDGDQCTEVSCDSEDGCLSVPLDAAPCDDGDPCTDEDTCMESDCVSGAPACDDEDLCTDDACDEDTGACMFTPTDVVCDDGDPCTEDSACEPDTGDCGDTEYVCDACVEPADCPALPPCGGTWQCLEGECVLEAGSGIDCGDLEPPACHTIGCDVAAAQCVVVPVADGEACEDGNKCSTGDVCQDGACEAGVGLSCDDDDECTVDACIPATGCVFKPASGAQCDDDDVCTTSDVCFDGDCVGAAPLLCEDGNECTGEICDPEAGCQYTTLTGAACDDGEPCTVGDTCGEDTSCTAGPNECTCEDDPDCEDNGDLCDGHPVCVGGLCTPDPSTAIGCQPSSEPGSCVAPACQPATGECVPEPLPDGTLCDDGDPCTAGDACTAGACEGTAIVCDDGEECTADSCDPQAGCTTEPTDGPCDDGNACTEGETCSAGECAGGTPLDCNDANICTADACLASSGCKHSYAVGQCNDGTACTVDDACKKGVCIGNPVECPEGDVCLEVTCDPETGDCVEQAEDCDDGDVCTSDACAVAEGCQHGPVVCLDGDLCTVGSCDADAGGCVFDDVVCEPADACHTSACQGASGNCIEKEIDCTDDDPCTLDGCGADGCTNETVICDDGEPCTEDVCSADDGSCVATPIDCDDEDTCTTDACIDGECSYVDVSCDDDNLCTDDDCDSVSGCTHEDVDCDDGVDCTEDTCLTLSGCSNLIQPEDCDDANECTFDLCDPVDDCVNEDLDGLPCDDGDVCTENDFCDFDSCTGGQIVCGPCQDKAQGEGCDDEDPDTVGDMCLDSVCLGFVVQTVLPEGAAGAAALDRVTWMEGDFFTTGRDVGATDPTGDLARGWVAVLGADFVEVLPNTLLQGERYTVLTDRLAATDGGSLAFLDGDGAWYLESQLADAFDAASVVGVNGPIDPQTILAGWGGAHDDHGLYYLAGRDDLQSWVLRCDFSAGDGTQSCQEESISYSFYGDELPRAMHGWGLDVDAADLDAAIVLADFDTGAVKDPLFNDAIWREGPNPFFPWILSFFDDSGSDSISRDVHGSADDNLWWAGTDGLIQGKVQQQNGSVEWVDLKGVVGKQKSYDFNGVYANNEIAIYAATRTKAGGDVLALVTHPVAASASDAEEWRVVELLKIPTGGGELQDVWIHDGVIVVVGWRLVSANGISQPRALVLVREP